MKRKGTGRVSFFPSSRKHGDGNEEMTFYSRCSEITNIIDRIISTIRCILIIEFHLHNQFHKRNCRVNNDNVKTFFFNRMTRIL